MTLVTEGIFDRSVNIIISQVARQNMESEPKATRADRDPSHELESGQEENQEVAAVTVTGQFKAGHWVPRSCHACNSKKIKCDKKDPCSACTRAGRPCAFPSPGPRKRRTRKVIMADMASRISSLEETLTRARDGAVLASPLRDTDKGIAFDSSNNNFAGRHRTRIDGS